jgi:archaellum component FlaC
MVGCMAVMERERWTDERLDKAFSRVDGDLRELRVEMRQGFEHIDQRFDQIDRRFDQIDKRFEQVDKRFEQVDKRFEQVDKRFEQVDKRFERVDDRFEAMQVDMTARFDAVQRNMLMLTIAMFSTMLTFAAAIVGAVAFG